MLGRRLRNKSLGIVGMGRIGTAVATRVKAFGLNIHYYSRNRRPPALEQRLDARYWDSLDAMIEEVDIVSLHTPYTRDTFQILDAARIARLKHDAFVVNVSRPELIDENALLDGIESGAHAYFVHSYHFVPALPDDLIATTDYGGTLTAVIGNENIAGTQFHPEKSQATGLKLLSNFLKWRP